MKLIVFFLLFLGLFSCNLVSDMKKGLTLTTDLSKKYECLENKFSVETINGKIQLTIGLKCEDATGLYLGKVILEYHRAMKKAKIIADEYLIKNSKTKKEFTLQAELLDKSIVLEEKVFEYKRFFETKQYIKVTENCTEELTKKQNITDFLSQNDSLIQSNYSLKTGFDIQKEFAIFGFEEGENHFLILGVQLSSGKIDLIRLN